MRLTYEMLQRNTRKLRWEKKKIDIKRILKTIKRLISDKSFLRDRVIFLEKD